MRIADGRVAGLTLKARLAMSGLLLLGVAWAAPAQVKYPPRAEKLDVTIRYRIRADRDERILQYRAMTGSFARLGFIPAEREDADLQLLDPTAERLDGTIPSERVLELLNDPRVLAILFAPQGTALPEDLAQPVPLRLGLNVVEVPPRDRRRFHRQAVDQLERLGFQEALGYDHRNFSLVRGSLPAGKVQRLLKDLRGEPGGWFLPDDPRELLPAPLRDASPIRWVEILPEAEIKPFTPPASTGGSKFTEALKAALAEMMPGQTLRVEAVMDRPVDGELQSLRNRLRSDFPGINIEGASGALLTLSFPNAAFLERFANEADVLALRRPAVAQETVSGLGAEPAPADQPPTAAQALTRLGLDRLHALGQRGEGVRLIVIGTDFTGALDRLGQELPARTRLIDLTAELSSSLMAEAGAGGVGRSLPVAIAAAAAAPNAELVLLRVKPDAFFQLQTALRFILGQSEYSPAMQSRIDELSQYSQELARRKISVVDEYRKAFADLSDDPATVKRREAARKALNDIIAEEKEVSLRYQRFTALQEALKGLAGGNIVVVNSLVWESGYPLDALSQLSRRIDEQCAGSALRGPVSRSATRPSPPNAPLWVQAASNIPGSVWGGPFLDLEGNGVMEFAPPQAPLPEGSWSRELNFLGLRSPDGQLSPQLPGGKKIRITVQWREAHQPDTYMPPDPVLPITLRVLKQLDPDGTTRASDEMEEVARSVGPVVRLTASATFAVYEQSVEFTPPAEGRYALFVQAQAAFDHRLPALREEIEIHPGIVVEFTEPTADGQRPVFTTFTPPVGGVGIPGDSPSALTVGVEPPPHPRLLGGGPGTVLLPKPNLLAPGTMTTPAGIAGQGTGIAAGYLGGLAACLIAADAPAADIPRTLQAAPGEPARIPSTWLQWVRPRR